MSRLLALALAVVLAGCLGAEDVAPAKADANGSANSTTPSPLPKASASADAAGAAARNATLPTVPAPEVAFRWITAEFTLDLMRINTPTFAVRAPGEANCQVLAGNGTAVLGGFATFAWEPSTAASAELDVGAFDFEAGEELGRATGPSPLEVTVSGFVAGPDGLQAIFAQPPNPGLAINEQVAVKVDLLVGGPDPECIPRSATPDEKGLPFSVPRALCGLMPGSRRITKDEVLAYHAENPRGKISVTPTKPTATQRDLSIAYSPGVAIPCEEIARDPDLAYRYTAKGNLVAVVSNGTAVLGLGNIGALAGKPVMEGKGVLFKKFADIDVFDLEVDATDVDEFCRVVRALEPTFGGINLEDIKAPECFAIEERLKREMQIPVFHDDQHGTAIISGAALLNALEIQGKRIEEVRIVIAGAGAAAIACANFYVELGADLAKILMVDSKGVLHEGRTEGMNPYKQRFARATSARTIADALKGADVFVGVSVAGLVTTAMLKTMGPRPIVFALANPDPEIPYADAKAARPDAIVATGRSDFPNQVNNVLGYPFIFRGALDVRARAINEEMKVAAAKALAALAKEDVVDEVLRAYGDERIVFGPEYIIPKPFDPRVLLWVAPAIAEAAIASGVARKRIDVAQYRDELEARLGKSREMMRIIYNKARRAPKRIVFPEGESETILRACQILHDERIAHPILLGNVHRVRKLHADLKLDFPLDVADPAVDERCDRYAAELFRLRQRKGITESEARELVRGNRNYFAAMLLREGGADGLVSGLTTHYPEALRPALHVVGLAPGVRRAVGLYMMTVKRRVLFFADATVNIDPSAADLAEIAIQTAAVARRFDVAPRVAMLSFSNFGSTRHPLAEKVALAVRIARERDPTLVIDGEMQADTAIVEEILRATYPFSRLTEPANVLIFPDLQSANIAYKLLQRLSDAEATGPMLQGMAKPVHILQRDDAVADVVNMAAVAVVEGQAGK